MGLSAFTPHLQNKLFKMGYDLNAANSLILKHIEVYDELLDKLLMEIIAESRRGKLDVILQRNPSLLQGSAQRVNITRVKKDPGDHTISLSILIVKAFNCDFDGDALNISIAIDNKMADMWYPLDPRFNLLPLTTPYKIGSAITIPKPVISSISKYLDD
jgi:DNA-directed RNA polymerase beta' subunit